MPKELQVTNDFGNGKPEWEMVLSAGVNEMFMGFYMRGGKGVLVSNTSIYLIDETLSVTGYATDDA